MFIFVYAIFLVELGVLEKFMHLERVLMTKPTYYDVVYEINPWMNTSVGVDKSLAMQQWQGVVNAYEKLGVKVELMEPDPKFPDMVFSANVGLVQGNSFLRSNFKYEQRRGEAHLAEEWFRDHNFKVTTIPEELSFEGTGDALICGDFIFGGYGFRTEKEAYSHVSEAFNMEVVPIQLHHDRFYHLDTCLAVLNDDTVLCYADSFSPEDVNTIQRRVKNFVRVSRDDNMKFACNSLCVDDSVIINAGISDELKQNLTSLDFKIIEVDTGEFIKAGGSVWCMTLALR